MAERIDWPTVLAEGKAIVESYTTGVTLRQLFYRLVANQTLVNTSSAYKSLSSRTAQARRDDVFPDLIDRGRSIHRYGHFDGTAEAIDYLVRMYRRDRTEGQAMSIYVGVEKAGLVMQLQSGFEAFGLPIDLKCGVSGQRVACRLNLG